MSCILYYSNFCEPSKKLLQTVSKTEMAKDIHFICIDKRVKENDKMFIILQNGHLTNGGSNIQPFLLIGYVKVFVMWTKSI